MSETEKFLTYPEAVKALESGDCIRRFGSMYPYYRLGSLGLEEYYNGGSAGECVKQRGVHIPPGETVAVDWIVYPKADFDKWMEHQRVFYAEQAAERAERNKRTLAAGPPEKRRGWLRWA